MSKRSSRRNRQERRKNHKMVQETVVKRPEPKKAVVEARTSEARTPRMPTTFQLPEIHLPGKQTAQASAYVVVSCIAVALLAAKNGYTDPGTLFKMVYLWLLFVVAPGYGAYRLIKDSLEAQKKHTVA